MVRVAFNARNPSSHILPKERSRAPRSPNIRRKLDGGTRTMIIGLVLRARARARAQGAAIHHLGPAEGDALIDESQIRQSKGLAPGILMERRAQSRTVCFNAQYARSISRRRTHSQDISSHPMNLRDLGSVDP